MRGIKVIAAIVLSASSLAFAQPHVNVSASADFSFDELNQYGEWVNVNAYGEVWRPYAGPEWRPFVYGRWVWSNDGWMWESDEPFGWIACHYGNWTYEDDWGWVWVPGYDWSPARVEWHVSDTEIGWMPMLPSPRPGHRSHARVEWTFCPFDMFSDIEIHRHVSYRPQTSVVVRMAPPKIEFVRSHSRARVVTVAPRKVYVQSSHRQFVRVDAASSHHHRVVVPVGPQFRVRSHDSHRAVTVNHRPPEQPRGRVAKVTVRKEATHHDVEPQRNSTIQVRSRHGGQSANRARVESGSEDNHHHSGEVHRSVTVRKRDH